ncbi:hypothetical protein Tco_1170066 [Tanacetum coccineum]
MKIEESLNVTFDETPPPSKTSPLVDDDSDEDEAIKVTEKKNLKNNFDDETLKVDEIVNIKESKNHPLENVKMDNLNITIEEYIMLEEEKACRRGKVYNWETATYGKIWDNEDVHDLGSIETEFSSIVFNDTLTSEAALSCEPTITVLKTNTPYSSRKIWRIRACTHQRPQKIKDQYTVSRGLNTPYSRYGINIIFWKISNVVSTLRNP